MKLPRLSGSELAAALRQLGYRITRQSGSHLRLSTQRNGQHHATIPLHRSLKAGTARAVPRDVAKYHGLTREKLLEQLFERLKH